MFGCFPVILVQDILYSFDLPVIVLEFVGHQREIWGDELRGCGRSLGHGEILVELLRVLVVEVAEDLGGVLLRALVDELKLLGAAKVGSTLVATGRAIESRHQSSASDIYLALWKIPHG